LSKLSGAFRETVQRAAGDEFLALARASNARIRLQKQTLFAFIAFSDISLAAIIRI
jgi:hypothetical protein